MGEIGRKGSYMKLRFTRVIRWRNLVAWVHNNLQIVRPHTIFVVFLSKLPATICMICPFLKQKFDVCLETIFKKDVSWCFWNNFGCRTTIALPTNISHAILISLRDSVAIKNWKRQLFSQLCTAAARKSENRAEEENSKLVNFPTQRYVKFPRIQRGHIPAAWGCW